MVVTCFSALGQPFGSVVQTASCQQLAMHHHRCGRSGASESRCSGCCEPVQYELRLPQRALRQLHRLLRFVRRVLERVEYLRERITRVLHLGVRTPRSMQRPRGMTSPQTAGR